MDGPDNIVLVQLRVLREEVARLEGTQDALTKRFDAIRQAVEGESFMGRVTAAEIEQQLIRIGERLDALEAKSGPGTSPQ